MSQLIRAAQFAAYVHHGQTRKYGHSDRPYMTHVIRVAGRTMTIPGATIAMGCASWNHDTVEDGENPDEIKRLIRIFFGDETLEMVLELTNPSKDFPDMPRVHRKLMDREHIATISKGAKTIKLIDRIDNVREMLDDPETPESFVKLYVPESRLLLDVLRGTNAELEDELESLL